MFSEDECDDRPGAADGFHVSLEALNTALVLEMPESQNRGDRGITTLLILLAGTKDTPDEEGDGMKQRTLSYGAAALIGLLGLLACNACAIITYSPYGNKPKTQSTTPTRADLRIDEKQKSDGMFVGLAISGGGSRSAVFATSAMLELKKEGLLHHVDVISSVSGGSLPAAYYALEGYNGITFDETDALKRMKLDFQARWLARWFLPHNIVRYWFSDLTRSDIMVQVFDSNLFDSATFAHLNPERPKLLINSTDSGRFDRFTFSEQTFEQLHSDLSQYSIARAVNVSSAFPGAFHRVPLENFSPDRASSEAKYRHLYDGGPTDNLGVSTLLQVLLQEICGGERTTPQYTQQALRKKLVEKSESSCENQADPIPVDTLFPQGCLIISLDATPREDDEDGHRAHNRSVTDYFIDSNFLNATDVMLLSIRREVLENVGLSRSRQDKVRFSTFSFDGGRSHCHFWHVALRHFKEDDRAARIRTNFGLDDWEEDLLTRAGAAVVKEGLGIPDIPAIISRMTKMP
jgi:predicted acylesterase/phospholipase RssA